MKIVIVTPVVPHPFGDSAARWFYVLITELLARGHEVVAIASTEESEARVTEAKQWLNKQSGKLTLHCHRLHVDSFALRRKWRNLIRPRSELLQDTKLVDLLRRELAKGYDVLHLEQMSTGWLGLDVPRALLNVHYFDAIDWANKKHMSVQDRIAFWQARRATELLLRRIPNVRLLTPRLKQFAESINSNGNYSIVPLALDPTLYPMQQQAGEPIVGMIGSMNWEPSRSAAERLITRIWPHIRQALPQAKLYIAGWNAKRFLGQYSSDASLELAENLSHPTDFFSKAAVMIYAPSGGSGMKVKIMEAMAYGVPVVTTWEGVEGIDHKNGVHCWVAESDEDLAAKAIRLLENPQEARQMRQAARHLIEQRYSPRPVVDRMIDVYRQLIAASPPPKASAR